MKHPHDGSGFQELLEACASRHRHLCPRQVLGVRAGLAGGRALEVALPRQDKRILVFVETDGCFADGVEVACGVSVGKRTLKIEDYGKIAASVFDTRRDLGVRVVPRRDVRSRAWPYAPSERNPYFIQLRAYQLMPDEALFDIRPVATRRPVEEIISYPGLRAICESCGEEINNQREVCLDGQIMCRACAGVPYYREVGAQSG